MSDLFKIQTQTMNAIILTEDQAAQLVAAREPNAIRILEPRRLQDGRLILNADVLDDPYFADPASPWAAILAGEQVVVEEPKEGEPVKVDDSVREAISTGLAEARSAIVTLTEADLEERQEVGLVDG
jgi:hypothetical protein